jgi:hypothetical protein
MSGIEAARRVADAVLYEGYLLYPYRASSCKNQVRWQFGVVGPIGAEAAGVGEDSSMFTECLVQSATDVRVDVVLRFLHVQWRAVERRVAGPGMQFEPVDELALGSTRWIPWHEAVDREVTVIGHDIIVGEPRHIVDIALPGGEDVELLRDGAGQVVGRLVRTRWPLSGRLSLRARNAAGADDLLILRISLDNIVTWQPETPVAGTTPRDVAARRSFVSAHLLVAAHSGRFVSLVDPPEWAAEAAAACSNSRCWPVLVGVEGEQTADLVLGSPIILPEHPVIAEESPGDLYDATEIDEILTLRIMTMTDDEKLAARGTDPRAAAIIDRSDDMPPEVFERLHGALRGYAPSFDDSEIPTYGSAAAPWFDEAADAAVAPETDSVLINGVAVAKGSRVRLRPRRRADAHDMFLADRTAVVARIDLDVEGVTHVAVLLEDDPASDLHDWYGRYYYFGAEEVEPLPALQPSEVSP